MSSNLAGKSKAEQVRFLCESAKLEDPDEVEMAEIWESRTEFFFSGKDSGKITMRGLGTVAISTDYPPFEKKFAGEECFVIEFKFDDGSIFVTEYRGRPFYGPPQFFQVKGMTYKVKNNPT